MASSYWCRFPGDYMRDTLHLSWLEDCAYTRLLDVYYSTGKPLPSDLAKVCRMARATTQEERAAVGAVCEEFFPINGDGSRHNKRADRELAYQVNIHAVKSAAGRFGGRRSAKVRAEAYGTAQPGHNSSTTEADAEAQPEADAEARDQAAPKLPSPPHPLYPSPTQKERTAKAARASKRIFRKPTVEEVTAYCAERANGIDPAYWVDHYEANGWRVGKAPMRDWKAVIRTWEKNGIGKDGPGSARKIPEGKGLI